MATIVRRTIDYAFMNDISNKSKISNEQGAVKRNFRLFDIGQ